MMQGKRKRILTALLVVIPICLGGVMGWKYLWERPCVRLEIMGIQSADSASVYSLVDSTLTPQMIVDRLRRHPWIHSARAVCYPTGTTHVQIRERVPRLLVLTGHGDTAYYLDEYGYMMPPAAHVVFDVPLVRGVPEPYHAVRPMKNTEVRNLLALLSRIGPRMDFLVSEFEITESSLTLIARAMGADHTAIVRLGSEDWEKRLDRLYDFWGKEVERLEDRVFDVIDLRFDGQIITREKSA
ncbi:MAG: cell division protein FtsQ/DivIB [Bacteroidetes bacterium]|nr:cell division protein FtsQ/DivIB [Bacteroidota bacterium]